MKDYFFIFFKFYLIIKSFSKGLTSQNDLGWNLDRDKYDERENYFNQKRT